MPSTDLRSDVEDEPGAPEAPFGADSGAADTWESVRVQCPVCDRPIALIGDEERLPQHAVLTSAWNPFQPAICRGTGAPTAELPEFEELPARDGTDNLVALPGALDWRTQPFSHAGAHRAVRALVPAQRDRRAA
ncbi:MULTISPECIES: hypothetical protein [Kitasatospora]|uniref:Uncharacterized protein n=1 Tax=Kitasatospora setae (strain ATCC 33774 / DSM 43861 / JCM 3304 / KCC A-0304 / NBRC 14216 / KM-6054) TaxID=452652 RepID=E4N703_KITSK|nr:MULTISPECIES: hypothetical protein [Kitasatospora]BAJ26984.1 hypothetical protein KSE_11500 [Kitasatospora setae KM-6054]